ncbi:MAG: hypothetical protein ACI4PF_04765 [Christensenellales bacterium]
MSKKIYFDLDGTVYNLYGIENWLQYLDEENSEVFLMGDFMVDYKKFMDCIASLTKKGYSFGVITWLPMRASVEFEEDCRQQKIKWVKQFLPFVTEITCQSYGIPKQNAIQKKSEKMFLIDDNKEVCNIWEQEKNCIAVNLTKDFNVIDALNQILIND